MNALVLSRFRRLTTPRAPNAPSALTLVGLCSALAACGSGGGTDAADASGGHPTGGSPAGGADVGTGGTGGSGGQAGQGGQGGQAGQGGRGGAAGQGGQAGHGGASGQGGQGGQGGHGGAAGHGGQGGQGGNAGQGGGGQGGDAPDMGASPCVSDAACPPEAYCGPAGTCEPGCRDAESPCPPDAAGHSQRCDAPTHTCVPEVVCCDAVDACALTREDACEGVVLQAAVSCEAAPCGPECLSDEGCGAERYCHPVDFRCTLGCRLGEGADCPFDETCLPDTRVCGALRCDAHADCLDRGQYCDFVGALATDTCRDGCRDDAACGEGGRCGADHTCIFLCDVDNDRCPANHVCDAPSGRCVPLCETNDDCPADEICDALTARCAPGCRDDAFEPDDLLAEARALVFSAPDAEGLVHATAEGRMCALNPDVFAIALPEGGRFHASLDFEVDGLSFIALSTPEMAFGGELTFDTSPAEVTFPPLGMPFPAGPVYVTVLSESALGSDYTLSVELAVGDQTCFPDAHEPANDTPPGAQRFARETGTALGSVCADDEDWFVLRLGRNDGFALSVVSLTGGQPLRAEMYRASRVDLLPDAAPDYTSGPGLEGIDGTAYEIIVPTDTAGFSDEDWYVRLRGESPADLGEYRLAYDHTPSAIVCDDDSHTEPNDEPGTAVDLDLLRGISDAGRLLPDAPHIVPLDLALCPGDLDVFCLIADRDDSLSAAVESERGAEVRWLDGFGEPLTGLGGGHAPGEPVVPNRLGRVAAGRYCVQVAGAGGPYTLTVQRDVPAQFECAADVAETDPATGQRNDTAATATSAPPEGAHPTRFALDTGYLCDVGNREDEDWYRLAPDPSQARLCVTVGGFAASGGDVDLEVYIPGIEEEPSPCATDDECLEGTRCVDSTCLAPYRTSATRYQSEIFHHGRFDPIVGDGTAWLRIRRGQPPGEGVGYRIDVSNIPDAENCEPDGPERASRNDSPETATELGARDAALCDTWICPDERLSGDHFAVTVPAGEDRTVFIDYDDVNEGRLFLYATGRQPDPDDGLSGFARSELATGRQQCLNLHGGAAAQTFTLQVTGDRLLASRIDYALRVVPTDLAAAATGECEALGAPALPDCGPRDQWMSFPGIGRLQPDACIATLDAP